MQFWKHEKVIYSRDKTNLPTLISAPETIVATPIKKQRRVNSNKAFPETENMELSYHDDITNKEVTRKIGVSKKEYRKKTNEKLTKVTSLSILDSGSKFESALVVLPANSSQKKT